MRVAIVGMGTQGGKRCAVAGEEVAATVDPLVPQADYRSIHQVPLDSFDAALVCAPDSEKLSLLDYLLSREKHVLVEKPLLGTVEQLSHLAKLAHSNKVTCYTAYNHRFEPHIGQLKQVLEENRIGKPYVARFFYGNGTAVDVRNSGWRDSGAGVLSDLGSHLLDMAIFLFGQLDDGITSWSFNCFENRTFDHVLFGMTGGIPVLEFEATLLSWCNSFTIDVLGELGSIHVDGLCKWGPSKFAVRTRVFPSGHPAEEVYTLEQADPTWKLEYEHFKVLCHDHVLDFDRDILIGGLLSQLAHKSGVML